MRVLIGIFFAALALAQSQHQGAYNAHKSGVYAYKQFATDYNNNNDSKMWAWKFTAHAATSVTGLSLYVQYEYGTVTSLSVEIVENLRYRTDQWASLVTWTDATDIVNLTAHGFSNGDTVRFFGGTLPAGVTAHATYYVCNANADDFQIDDDSGCASVVSDFSGASGSNTVRRFIAVASTISPAVAINTWSTIGSFSAHTLTANKQYWCVIRNSDAAPGTNYIRRLNQYTVTAVPFHDAINPAPLGQFDGGEVYSADIGLTFTMQGPGIGWAIEFADGVLLGQPGYSAATIGSGERVHGTQEAGIVFRSDANAKLRVRGMQMQYYVVGTPVGALGAKLYKVGSGTDTLVASAASARTTLAEDLTSNADYGVLTIWFSSSAELDLDTYYRLVLYSSGGDSSNAYALFTNTIWDDDKARKLLPFARGNASYGARKTFCSGTCTTTANWTDSTTVTIDGWAMILDSAQPYGTISGGGGQYGFGHAH